MVTFETGATSFAVNDVILFTDSTKELAEVRDSIYSEWVKDEHTYKNRLPLSDRMNNLFFDAVAKYKKQFPQDHWHISRMGATDINEYSNLYAADFENWKQENL